MKPQLISNDLVRDFDLSRECHNHIQMFMGGDGVMKLTCTKCDSIIGYHQSHPTMEITRTRIWPFYLLKKVKA